jgi:hypothetical protein
MFATLPEITLQRGFHKSKEQVFSAAKGGSNVTMATKANISQITFARF